MSEMNRVGLLHLLQFVWRAAQWLGCDTYGLQGSHQFRKNNAGLFMG